MRRFDLLYVGPGRAEVIEYLADLAIVKVLFCFF
jgi:hypothetical protein